jgi:hypothetical protein
MCSWKIDSDWIRYSSINTIMNNLKSRAIKQPIVDISRGTRTTMYRDCKYRTPLVDTCNGDSDEDSDYEPRKEWVVNIQDNDSSYTKFSTTKPKYLTNHNRVCIQEEVFNIAKAIVTGVVILIWYYISFANKD